MKNHYIVDKMTDQQSGETGYAIFPLDCYGNKQNPLHFNHHNALFPDPESAQNFFNQNLSKQY